uniref:CD3epsilon.b n=1 Tax=Xenopus laevis TaxID=8355 RepID=A0A0K0VJH2_XENLA|nr:CD3epsilon.b [Xenopus laevis]
MLHAGLLSADTEGGKIQVSISRRTVVITCPAGKGTIKFKEDRSLTTEDNIELTDFADENNGMYSCGAQDPAYLYLKAYVCDNCKEVSIPMVAGILIGDCMVTLGVAFVIYFGCRKQTGPLREGGMTNGARAKGKQEKPPPVPNPDYEVLRKDRRDLYDGLGTRTRLK